MAVAICSALAATWITWAYVAAPAVEERAADERTLNGYNLVSWMRDGLAYSAISDLNMAELRRLSEDR